MTDVFKSADWVREALEQKAAEKLEIKRIDPQPDSSMKGGSGFWPVQWLTREEALKRWPPPVANPAVVEAILADPVAVRELQRPDGIIVIAEGQTMPTADELNKARGVILQRRMTREEFDVHFSCDGQMYEDPECTILWGSRAYNGFKPPSSD